MVLPVEKTVTANERFSCGNVVTLNDRRLKHRGTRSPSNTDILSAGLQMPGRLPQEMPFVTFHLLSDTPPHRVCNKSNLNDIERQKRWLSISTTL